MIAPDTPRDCPRRIGDLIASANIGLNAHTDTTPHNVPAPGSVTNDYTMVTTT
jgi:hypothetical protein